MTIGELKAEVEKYRQGLKDKDQTVVMFSESGPVGMVLIDALVKVVERQDQRIAQLEKGVRLS